MISAKKQSDLTSEPLLDLELLNDVYEYAKIKKNEIKKEIYFYFCTNGTILSDEALVWIKKIFNKNKKVPVSIDGPREVHDRMRKYADGKGTYDDIIKFIDKIKKEKMPLEANAVLTSFFPNPAQILEHLLDLGFTSISLKPVRAGYKGEFTEKNIDKLIKGYEDYFQLLEKQFLKGNFDLLYILKHDYALRPLWKLILKFRTNIRCIWGSTHIVLDAEGNFYPCDSVIGNKEYSVGNVIDGINWERFHSDFSCQKRKPCQSCWASGICGGTCYVSGINIDDNPLSVDPVECRLNIFLVERNIKMLSKLQMAGISEENLAPILLSK
jgi:uncharacterized protein